MYTTIKGTRKLLYNITSLYLSFLMIVSFINFYYENASNVYTVVQANATNEIIEEEPIEDFLNNELVTRTLELEQRRQMELEQQILEEQRRLEELRLMTTVETSNQTMYYDINIYTDLSIMNTVTTEQMNLIIDHWNSQSGYNSPFVGLGQTFIDAAKETGLDPVYILAHAGLESGWGKSQIARDKHNYFGIGAFDNSPYESAYTMADETSQGIMKGAIWIANNYYNRGQTSLYTMRYNNGYHEYCTSTTWTYNIASIMRTSYSLIQ